MKTKWTKEEVLTWLNEAREGSRVPDISLIEMIMYVERMFYNKHIDDIRKRQSKLKHLHQDKNKFLAFWIGGKAREEVVYKDFLEVISPGCRGCLSSIVTHVRHATECSQNCFFCYYRHSNLAAIGKGLYAFSGRDMTFTLDEAKLLVDRQLVSPNARHYEAVGWLQREPLERADAIYPLMSHISKKGVHQYLYTNGVHATKDVVDKLADSGLNEIRFNLASTDFADDVIERMAYAKEKIPWVLIETPIFSKSYQHFVEKGKDIVYHTGLDQINIPELQVVYEKTLLETEETEGFVYKHRRGYISPISSRHYAYDLIDLAEKEDWPVIINDCSNDTKFYRGALTVSSLGYVDYPSTFELPFDRVMVLAANVLEDGVTYEFF